MKMVRCANDEGAFRYTKKKKNQAQNVEIVDKGLKSLRFYLAPKHRPHHRSYGRRDDDATPWSKETEPGQ